MIEFIIKLIGPKKKYSNKNKCLKYINKKRKEKKYKLPNIKFKSNISKEIINNCDIYKFYNSNSNNVVIYLHGGGYINEANIYYFKFVDKIAKQSNIDIYLPLYPLAPNHTYKETYELLLNLYNKLINENKNIILMGDSAGGGLALGFTQYLIELNIKSSYKLILMSPWVDITMSNPNIKEYENIDPILGSLGLIEVGKLWSGNIDTKNYKVSPLYGNLNNIPDTLIFTGKKEILYPDICLLYNKLKENNIKCELVIQNKMYHAYPLLPFKESKEAIEKILNKICE